MGKGLSHRAAGTNIWVGVVKKFDEIRTGKPLMSIAMLCRFFFVFA